LIQQVEAKTGEGLNVAPAWFVSVGDPAGRPQQNLSALDEQHVPPDFPVREAEGVPPVQRAGDIRRDQ
jgi:hypothetical protein